MNPIIKERMYRKILIAMAAIAMCATLAHAQETDGGTKSTPPTPEEIKEQIDGIGDRVTLVENDVAALKNVKVSGYVQAEWQHFDQSSDASGRAVTGYFNARKNFFTIRRGEIKVQYKSGDIVATILPDVTESGVAIREAWGQLNLINDPEMLLAFTAGMFNRPNYEVEISSSVRESPERSQVIRAFYPGDRDLGLMFTAQPTLMENFDPKLQLGIFNGPGAPNAEVDAYKDIMGRLTFPIPLGTESLVQADLGVSYYYGGIPQNGDMVIKTVNDANVQVANDATGNLAGWGNNKNFGLEAQVYIDALPFGGTILKGELLGGSRATAGALATPATASVGKDSAGKDIVVVKAATPAGPVQIRNQSGFYGALIQNIENWMQIVVKYDMYDRNTDLTGEAVKSASDAASSVLGFGLNFFYQNVRITAYYEMPSFATGEVAGRDKSGAIISTDDIHDDKATIRFQFKF